MNVGDTRGPRPRPKAAPATGSKPAAKGAAGASEAARAAGAAEAKEVAPARPPIQTRSTFKKAEAEAAYRTSESLEDGLLSRESFSAGKKGPAAAELSDSLQALSAKLAALSRGEAKT